MTHERKLEEDKVIKQKPVEEGLEKERPVSTEQDRTALSNLQHTIGNQAVQRLLAQRSGEGSFELDDETTGRINQARGGGQALDANIQKQISAATGQDLSGVRVHTSPEADELNQQLSARAFTTGQDIFFKEGAYDPGSSSGQELITHELTHVAQQSAGVVSAPGGGMTVNAPGDRFEQEADSFAKTMTSTGVATQAQRQEIPEEEELAQTQAIPEEEEEAIQTQAEPEEEEEPGQLQELPEEEESLQRQDEIPEEEI